MKLTFSEAQLLVHLISKADGLGRVRRPIADQLLQKAQHELTRRKREARQVEEKAAENLRKFGSPFGACQEEACGKPAYTEWKAGDGTKFIFCREHNDEYLAEAKKQRAEILPTLCLHDVLDKLRTHPGLTRLEVLQTVQRGYPKKLVFATIEELLKNGRIKKDGANQLYAARA